MKLLSFFNTLAKYQVSPRTLVFLFEDGFICARGSLAVMRNGSVDRVAGKDCLSSALGDAGGDDLQRQSAAGTDPARSIEMNDKMPATFVERRIDLAEQRRHRFHVEMVLNTERLGTV